MKTKLIAVLFSLIIISVIVGCSASLNNNNSNSDNHFEQSETGQPIEHKYSYGVFIGVEPENINEFSDYETIVIDAAYFSKEQIAELKEKGHTVYSYLNIGSIENFRSYYQEYKKYTLGEYENWPGEYWIDAGEQKWQDFVINTLAKNLSEKGVDGFFTDNADVYYLFETQSIYNGIKKIFEGLSKYKLPIIVNGGDVWITEAVSKQDHTLIFGVNQECVFTSIDFENETLKNQTASDTKYFKDYLKECKNKGLKVYLLEYSKDDEIKKTIHEFCVENDYSYYVSENISLD